MLIHIENTCVPCPVGVLTTATPLHLYTPIHLQYPLVEAKQHSIAIKGLFHVISAHSTHDNQTIGEPDSAAAAVHGGRWAESMAWLSMADQFDGAAVFEIKMKTNL